MQGPVDLPVPLARQPVPSLVAGGGVDGCGAVPRREVVAVGEPGDVADLDRQAGGPGGSDAVQVQQGGAGRGDQLAELLVRCLLPGMDPLEIAGQLGGQAASGLACDITRADTGQEGFGLGGGQVLLRSRPSSSASGHSRSPGWSHPVHGGDGASVGVLDGSGADAMRRARRAAKGAAPASGDRSPPDIAASAVTASPPSLVTSVKGVGHGKPDQARCSWTARQPMRRRSYGRALITTCRSLLSCTPTTSERCPERNSTDPSPSSKCCWHHLSSASSSTTLGSIPPVATHHAAMRCDFTGCRRCST